MAPFVWDEDRRALLRAELDAYYARLYGLTRDELRYILDPQDIYGPNFPGETFRVLKDNETAKYGEYRTRRLVLEAWDRLESTLGPVDPDRLKSSIPVSVPSAAASFKGKNSSTPKAIPGSSRTAAEAPRTAANPPARNAAARSHSGQRPLSSPDKSSPQPSLFTPAEQEPPDTVPTKQNTVSESANPYPASENWSLFKCSVCGRHLAGFSRAAHEKSHPGRKVDWKKI